MPVTDAWVNLNIAGLPWQRQVAEKVFHRPVDEVVRKTSPDELVAMMDEAGVDRAIVGVHGEAPDRALLAAADRLPERLALAVDLDPRRGMKAVRAFDALVKNHRAVTARLLPCLIGAPPDDRIYYPIYTKAVELGVPVCVTVGLPAPPLPGRCQDPIALDDVCLFFPELTVVMANGADPWWDVAIRQMGRFPRLHLMTSAWSPRRLPPSLLAFMNGRGADQIVFGTDFPFLTFERCLAEARALELGDGVLDKYLHGNAARLFGGR